MRTTPTRLAAGTAMGALVASGLLFTAPAAQAATYKTITNLDVNQDDTRTKGHNDFLDDGVRVYTDSNDSQSKAAGYFKVDRPLATAGEPSMVWTAGADQAPSNLKPSVQLVVDYNGDGSADGILVGEPTYADGSQLYGNDWWLSNGSKQGFKDKAPLHTGGSGSDNHGTLDAWRDALPNAQIVKGGWSLGSGVKGDGTIKQINVGSVNYRFAAATVTEKTVRKSAVDLSGTLATGHNEFRLDGGVRVYTESNTSTDRASGFVDIDAPLQGLGEPSLDYVQNGDVADNVGPGAQLRVDFDGDGSIDGALVGEPTYADGTALYGNDWWLTNSDTKAFVKDNAPSHTGGKGSDNHGTLGQWRDAFPDAQVLTAGYSLGSGVKGDFIVSSLTVGATKYSFTGEKIVSTTDFTRVNPKRPSSKKVFHVYATVTAPGVSVKGGAVKVTNSGKTIGTGTLNSAGKVKIKLTKKLAKGNRTITISYAGTSQIAPSKESMKVRIK